MKYKHGNNFSTVQNWNSKGGCSQKFEFKAHIFQQIRRVYHIGVRPPDTHSKVNVAS